MTISGWQIPHCNQPKFAQKEFPGGWFELSVGNWKDYFDLVNWLDRMISDEFELFEGKTFQNWPRIYYLGVKADRDVFSIRMTWINSPTSLVD